MALAMPFGNQQQETGFHGQFLSLALTKVQGGHWEELIFRIPSECKTSEFGRLCHCAGRRPAKYPWREAARSLGLPSCTWKIRLA